jgi:UPF0176 protein
MQLYNIHSKEILLKKLQEENFKRVTVSFYQYAHIADPQQFRDELFAKLQEIRVLGRIYVAHEGINAQVNCPEPAFETFREILYSYPFMNGIRLNVAVEEKHVSFLKLAIKVREKIVADGITDPDFDILKKGKYLDAEAFNRMVEDGNTILIDMRNHYEYEVGHFGNAIEVPSDTFRDQLPMTVEMMQDKKDRNIIMYCTGGIRCEKASAYMLHNGFDKVYHLEGGIIHYTNIAREKGLPNKFIGKNFVFDERLGERITEDIIAHCHQCEAACDDHTNCRNEACHLLFIQCKACAEKYDGCCSDECKNVLTLPKEEQKLLRKGKDLGQNIFRKGRWPGEKK